jgi:hypothetical protein
LNVIVAGEESGIVREAFVRRGHNAWSCDLKPSRRRGNHYIGSWRDIDPSAWDLLIAHPECTHLAVSGAKHFAAKRADGRQQAAIEEFIWLDKLAIPRKCLEQPVSIIPTVYRRHQQIIHPWQFGHPEFKTTCLYLTNLPLLQATEVLDRPVRGTEEWKRWNKVHRAPPGVNRARDRSETYAGIADAMAAQWGELHTERKAA